MGFSCIVRDLRAIYRPFGSSSSESAKIGTYVHNSILFRFLPGAKSGRHFEKIQNGRRFNPIVCDTTFLIFFGSGNPILTLFLRSGIKVTLILG